MSGQNKLLKGLMGTAGALALMVSLTGEAKAAATVEASAILIIDDFILASDSSGTVYTNAEILPSSIANTANTGGVGLVSVGGTLTQAGASAGDVKLTGICEGTCPVSDDDYSALSAPPTTHFAYADADLTGVAISGLGPPPGADAKTRADSGLLSTDIGDADANVGLTATFDFIAGSSGPLFIDFTYTLELLAFVSTDPAVLDASAVARTSWSIFIIDNDNTSLFANLSPAEINLLLGRDEISDGLLSISTTANLNLFLINLIQGDQYSLTITHEVFSDTSLRVPEPETLALMAGGLIFLAFFGLRGRRPEDAPGAS